MDIIDRYILLCVFLLIGCTPITENNVIEVRKYEIGGIDEVSIWYDTLYEKSSINKNELSSLIYGIDSALLKNRNNFDLHESRIKIGSIDSVQGVMLIKYTAESPTKNGYISFFGIYASGIGTIYWRWLDGKKYLRLLEKKISGDENIYVFTDILNHLDTTDLSIPPKPQNQEYKNEVEEELRLDTTLLNRTPS